MEWSRFACRRWGIIVVMKAWSFGSCMMRNVNCGFGLISCRTWRRNWLVVASISLQVLLVRERPLSCMRWRKSALRTSKSCLLKTLSRSSRTICFNFSWMTRSAWPMTTWSNSPYAIGRTFSLLERSEIGKQLVRSYELVWQESPSSLLFMRKAFEVFMRGS